MSSIDVLRLRINSIDKAIEYAKWQKSMFPQDREELCESINTLKMFEEKYCRDISR